MKTNYFDGNFKMLLFLTIFAVLLIAIVSSARCQQKMLKTIQENFASQTAFTPNPRDQVLWNSGIKWYVSDGTVSNDRVAYFSTRLSPPDFVFDQGSPNRNCENPRYKAWNYIDVLAEPENSLMYTGQPGFCATSAARSYPMSADVRLLFCYYKLKNICIPVKIASPSETSLTITGGFAPVIALLRPSFISVGNSKIYGVAETGTRTWTWSAPNNLTRLQLNIQAVPDTTCPLSPMTETITNALNRLRGDQNTHVIISLYYLDYMAPTDVALKSILRNEHNTTPAQCYSVVYDKNFRPTAGILDEPRDVNFHVHCITRVLNKKIEVKMRRNDTGYEEYVVNISTPGPSNKLLSELHTVASDAYQLQHQNYNIFSIPNYAQIAKANGLNFGLDTITATTVTLPD